MIVILVELLPQITIANSVIASYCLWPKTLELQSTDATSPDPVSFEYVGQYLNSDGESAKVLVKKGTASTPYKMYSFDKTGQLLDERSCPGTNDYDYVNLIDGYLFLHDSNNYYVCKYDPSADSSRVQLTTASLVTGALREFLPYYAVESTIYVMASSDTQTRIHTYTYAATGPLTASGFPGIFLVILSQLNIHSISPRTLKSKSRAQNYI